MKITNSFEIDQPVDKVWEFFDDVPLVAACVPGANLTNKVGDDHYQGDVVISAGPVKLEFSGELKIKSRDEAKKMLVLDGVGADKKGRGNASTVLDVTLQPMGRFSRSLNPETAALERVAIGFWPVTCASAPIASSRCFFSLTATPTPMLTTIFSSRGMECGFERPSASASCGRTCFT